MKNPLIHAQKCALYDTDMNLITRTRFSKEEIGSLVIIFSQEPDFDLPRHFCLVPRETKEKFRTYNCTWDGTFSEFHVETTGLTYCICKVSTDDKRDTRQDLRINVSLDVEAMFNESSRTEPITIKDMSAGGFMFVSAKVYETGSPLAFSFTHTDPPLVITAEIVSSRPTRLPGTYAYGCKFTHLSKLDESAIRKFIFNYDLNARRIAKERL